LVDRRGDPDLTVGSVSVRVVKLGTDTTTTNHSNKDVIYPLNHKSQNVISLAANNAS
jgi:hypothetical protein